MRRRSAFAPKIRLEFQDLHVAHRRQGAQPLLNGVGHDLIDADDCNRILFLGEAAEVECCNIDVGLAEDGSSAPMKPGLSKLLISSMTG